MMSNSRRITLALIFGFVFTVVYISIVFIIMNFLLPDNTFLEVLGLPASFGYYAYKYLGGNDSADYVEKNTIIFFIIILAQPVLLYSLIAYSVLTFVPKIGRLKEELKEPPKPPEHFD